MKRILSLLIFALVLSNTLVAQNQEQIVKRITDEANNNSQLEVLAHELLDVIGPRLVGTPQMKQAHDWAVEKYKSWGISARNEQWGEWRGWERGITHIDLIEPRVTTLTGRQLAWSPNGPKKGITAEAVIIPEFTGEADFKAWLPSIKGKFVLVSMLQPTGRPDYNWEEFATEESFEKMKTERAAATKAFNENIKRTGHSTGIYANSFFEALEAAGAAGLIQSYWSQGFGANKVFTANTKKIPVVDLNLEDYGLVYRLAKFGSKPKIRLQSESKELGKVGTFNTVAEIKGTEKPDEYVMLSAHFDSWDGGTGATDNGTGTIMMMETMRILKKIYPNPKRTILVGHWGSEEQGLNGSRAFVEDHPEVVEGLQALFNQDNGTGRVVNISGEGFLNSYKYLNRWLSAVPREIRQQINTNYPGTPSGGGTDHASFVAAGAPGFGLGALNWSYFNYTWHTNLDTYDKIVFDDVRSNAILAAILVYMASEDPEFVDRTKSELPLSPFTGEQMQWPAQGKPERAGMLDK